jgi:hypothetical protein
VEQFENFELVFEWKVVPGGNSGVFYHVTEDSSAVCPVRGHPRAGFRNRL